MNSFRSRSSAETAGDVVDDLAGVARRAMDALAAALATDKELCGLAQRLAQLKQMRAAADVELRTARRQHESLASDAEQLFRLGKLPDRVALAEEIAEIYRRRNVADEAARLADARIASRKMEIGDAMWREMLADPVRRRGAQLAQRLAALLADAAEIRDVAEDLAIAGFRAAGTEAWALAELLGDARHKNSVGPQILRDAVRHGVAAEADLHAAAGHSALFAEALDRNVRLSPAEIAVQQRARR